MKKRGWLNTVLPMVLAVWSGLAQQQERQLFNPTEFPRLVHDSDFQRSRWFYQQRAHPLGYIPHRARLRALQKNEQSKASLATTAETIQRERWVNIGPAPIIDTFVGRAYSGRVTDIAVDPSDTSHWLIGAAEGGVWETRDSGLTWSAKTDDQASLAMGAIAFAPGNPNVIYAGTGEATTYADRYTGAGLLKSTNGGTTWELLADSKFSQAAFSDLKVDPANPDTVLFATVCDLFYPCSASGIFKSIDGGVSSSKKLSGVATDLEVDPSNFDRQYAGIGATVGDSSNGVYRSTDAGETWSLISGPWLNPTCGVGRVELAIAPANPNVLYVSIQSDFSSGCNAGNLLGNWRTDNAWAVTPSWVELPLPPSIEQSTEVIVDSANSSILYEGGQILRKFDGASWTDFASPIHVDQHTLAWAGGRLIVGNDGGVWSTTDGGNTWVNHNTDLSVTQFYRGSVHPTNPNFALGGSQDNGTEKWTGTDAWQIVTGGDGYDNAISSSRPDTDWVMSINGLGMLRTTDGGSYGPVNPHGGFSLFIFPLEKCPHDDDIFIAAEGNILWKSVNFFTGTSPAWVANGPAMVAPPTALAFAPSEVACETYAFGTFFGELRLTTDGGGTWGDIDLLKAVPQRSVTGMAFDRTNANVLYVTLSGFDEGTPGQPGHLFKTTDALAASPTWLNVSPPVNIPHNTIVIDPSTPSTLYVGTDIGIWKSTDGGNSWSHMGPESGMPNVAVLDLQTSEGTRRTIAFTHGRGAFVLEKIVGNRCPLSQGFWKNNPNRWPVSLLTLGSQTYSEATLLRILKTPPEGDASLILAHQLITAKLNIANGFDLAPVSATVADADRLLSTFSGKIPYGVRPRTATGQTMVAEAATLDRYNNGQLTPSCQPKRQ